MFAISQASCMKLVKNKDERIYLSDEWLFGQYINKYIIKDGIKIK